MLRTATMSVRIFMNLNEPVSGRRFAELVGQSEGAVRKARDRQSILKGITPDGKYIPSIASEEWGKPILEKFLTSVIPIEKPAIVEKPIRVKKEKKEPETIEEVVKDIMSEPLPSVTKKDIDSDSDEDLSASSSKVEAERKTAVLKAKILQITYQEKKGKLIPRDKLDKILFAYGQEIRNACEAYVNKVLDPVMSMDQRHEAKRFMDEEMYNTLVLLSEIPNREI